MALEIFKLVGSIFVDSEQANKSISKTDEKAQNFGKTLLNGVKTVGKWGAAVAKGAAVATGAAVTAVTAIGTASTKSYADYEQLIGGVETLFGESARKVRDYADAAYRTAGLSANDYMETVTSFSASLLQSLKGDTEKAAEAGNRAVIDMADNANKMGTDISSIQTAYQGFAKQNYTMLDNLKLGYGGTKQEMERLLADATKLSGIRYDISNLSDVYEAIHVVQTELGITGTTAKEAATTISGAIGSMKSQWKNFLTALSGEGWDIGVYVENLVDSIATVVDNLIPRIQAFLPNIVDGIEILAETLIPKIPPVIESLLPGVLNGAVALVQALVHAAPGIVQMLVGILPALLSAVAQLTIAIIDRLPDIVRSICAALPTLIPPLIDGIVRLFVSLCENFGAILQPIIEVLPEVIVAIVDALLDNLPTLIDGVIALAVGVVGATGQIIEKLVPMIPHIVQAIVKAIPNNIHALFNGIWQIHEALLDLAGSLVTGLWDWAKNCWQVLVDDVLAPIATWIYDHVITPIVDFFVGLWDSIQSIFSAVGTWVYDTIIAPVAGFFVGLWNKIVDTFHMVIDPWIEICKRAAALVYDKIIAPVQEFFVGLWADITALWGTVSGWVNEMIVQPVVNAVNDIWRKLKEGAVQAWEGIKGVFGSVADFFGNVFSKAWKKVKDIFSTGGKIFDGIKDGIVKAFTTVVNAIIKGINKVVKIPFDGINWALKKLKSISILGVSPFDWIKLISVPEIPQLARGGVLEKGQTGLLEGNGAEAVVPLENNRKWIRAVAQDMDAAVGGISGSRVEAVLLDILNTLGELLGAGIYLDTGALVGGLAKPLDQKFGQIAARKARA